MMRLAMEARRLGSSVLRTGVLYWLLAAVLVVPGAGAVLVSRTMGPPPLLGFAIWLAVAPVVPLVWVYIGMRLGEQDEPTRVGALKRAWPGSRGVFWLVDAVVTGAIALAAALLTTVCLVAVIPAWHEGGTGGVVSEAFLAIGVLGCTNALMLAWGRAWRSLLPGGWAGLVALLLPLGGFIGSFIVGSALPFPHASDPGFTSLLATDPWGYFIQKGGDVWGFGAYAPLAYQMMAGLLGALAVGTGIGIARQLGASRRMAAGMVVVGALMAGVLVLMTVEMTGLATLTARPTAAASFRRQEARRELVRLTVGLSRGIAATATVWPGHSGLSALFLNPRLRVVAVRAGGHPVPYSRARSGWIRFSRALGPVSVSYEGDPLVVRESWDAPVVASFANGSGAMLTGGGWYPLTGSVVAQPWKPPVLPYGLEVTNAGPGVALTNLGSGKAGVHWQTTSGLVVYAGRFTPVKLPGMVLWSGPSASAVWAGNLWAPFARVPTYGGHLYLSPGRPQLRQMFRFFGGRKAAIVVSLPWLAVPQAVTALGNPNTELGPAVDPAPNDTQSGTFGFLQSMGKTYANLAGGFANAEFSGLWPQWSPAWLMTDPRSLLGGANRFPTYQRPAQGLFNIIELTWVGFAQWYSPWPGNPPAWAVKLSTLPPTAGRRVWLRFRRLVAHGRWPDWRQIQKLAPAPKARP